MATSLLRRVATCATTACLLAATPSCTLAGALIGSAEPRYATELPTPDAAEQRGQPLTVGDGVRLKMVGTSGWVRGKYRGDRNGALLLGSDGVDEAIPYDQIRILQVERGSYAGEGLAIGLAVDLVVVIVGGSVVASSSAFGRGGFSVDLGH
jgi:hypothetical protein